jgi:hypothetical protein
MEKGSVESRITLYRLQKEEEQFGATAAKNCPSPKEHTIIAWGMHLAKVIGKIYVTNR